LAHYDAEENSSETRRNNDCSHKNLLTGKRLPDQFCGRFRRWKPATSRFAKALLHATSLPRFFMPLPPTIRSPSVNIYFARHISLLSEGISTKLGTHIHRVGTGEKIFQVTCQGHECTNLWVL